MTQSCGSETRDRGSDVVTLFIGGNGGGITHWQLRLEVSSLLPEWLPGGGGWAALVMEDTGSGVKSSLPSWQEGVGG